MSVDVIAVLDASFAQVFANARPLKATVKEESKPMEHPLETGAIVTDHRIIQPTEIELSMVLASEDYVNVYAELRRLYINGDILTVQTRAGSYTSMCIVSIPHEESPDAIDALTLALSLKEVIFVSPSFAPLKVRHAPDTKTKDRGELQGDASKKQPSILSGLFH